MRRPISKNVETPVKVKVNGLNSGGLGCRDLRARCKCLRNPLQHTKSRKSQLHITKRARMMIRNMKLKAPPEAHNCTERFQFKLVNGQGAETVITLQQLASILDKQRSLELS